MTAPRVGIVMGSNSDLRVMRETATALDELGIAYEVRVISAHRTPHDALAWGEGAAGRGIQVIVAGAGAAAHLAGVLAAVTPLPVIAVPIAATPLQGLDALLAMVQMPPGVPVATVAVDGGRNAGVLAARILAATDETVRAQVEAFRDRMAAGVKVKDEEVRAEFS